MAPVEAHPPNLDAPERPHEMRLGDSPRSVDGCDHAFAQSVAFEAAVLGYRGLNADDPAEEYSFRSVPSKQLSALHLLAYVYAGFRHTEPSLDTGLRFDGVNAPAQSMMGDL